MKHDDGGPAFPTGCTCQGFKVISTESLPEKEVDQILEALRKHRPGESMVLRKDIDVRPLCEGGLTVRDYFAAAALQSLGLERGASSGDGRLSCIVAKAYAEDAYTYADAMLRAREGK